MKNPYVRIVFLTIVNFATIIGLLKGILPLFGIKDLHSNPYQFLFSDY